jgi:hypothetical protein
MKYDTHDRSEIETAYEEIRTRNIKEIDEVTLLRERTPQRIHVELTATEIPAALNDIIGDRNLEVVEPDASDGRLSMNLLAPPQFRSAGSVELRKHGNSVVSTLPPDARTRAGFELGDRVSVSAKSGEIRITMHNEQLSKYA